MVRSIAQLVSLLSLQPEGSVRRLQRSELIMTILCLLATNDLDDPTKCAQGTGVLCMLLQACPRQLDIQLIAESKLSLQQTW